MTLSSRDERAENDEMGAAHDRRELENENHKQV